MSNNNFGIMAWTSFFSLSWFLILGLVETSNLTWGFWICFFILGFISALFSAGLADKASKK